MEEKISVVMPIYNGANRGYMHTAIKSVLDQSFTNVELIIVNDGSTDDTDQQCNKYLSDERVKYVYQENLGLSGARKTGMENATGDYIAFLDDDDYWANDKLEKQYDLLSKIKPDYGMVYTAINIVDENDELIDFRYKEADGELYEKLVYNGNIVTAPSSVMIKAKVAKEVGLFDPSMRSLEDLDYWMRVAKKFKIFSMKDPLTFYRVHSNSITAKKFRREEFYELCLYYKVLAEGDFDEDLVMGGLYRRFAQRHFYLGNFKECRKFLLISSAYKKLSLKQFALYFLSFSHKLSDLIKKLHSKRKAKIGRVQNVSK